MCVYMLSKMASCAIRELMARIECLVSPDLVNKQMSDVSTMGEVP